MALAHVATCALALARVNAGKRHSGTHASEESHATAQCACMRHTREPDSGRCGLRSVNVRIRLQQNAAKCCARKPLFAVPRLPLGAQSRRFEFHVGRTTRGGAKRNARMHACVHCRESRSIAAGAEPCTAMERTKRAFRQVHVRAGQRADARSLINVRRCPGSALDAEL